MRKSITTLTCFLASAGALPMLTGDPDPGKIGSTINPNEHIRMFPVAYKLLMNPVPVPLPFDSSVPLGFDFGPNAVQVPPPTDLPHQKSRGHETEGDVKNLNPGRIRRVNGFPPLMRVEFMNKVEAAKGPLQVLQLIASDLPYVKNEIDLLRTFNQEDLKRLVQRTELVVGDFEREKFIRSLRENAEKVVTEDNILKT